MLPGSLAELEEYGLQIEWRTGRSKPHKKYYYAMKEHEDAVIITIDDDMIYPDDLIEVLYSAHVHFPDCVIATRAHQITFDRNGNVRKYSDWDYISPKVNQPDLTLIATGVGGVLYPSHCMYEDLLNQKLFLELAPKADDLWLKVMQVLNGTRVVCTDMKVHKKLMLIPETQNRSLISENHGANMNDVYFANLIEHYGLAEKDFK